MAYRDDRTRKIIEYICQYNFKYDFTPSLEEIAITMGSRSIIEISYLGGQVVVSPSGVNLSWNDR